MLKQDNLIKFGYFLLLSYPKGVSAIQIKKNMVVIYLEKEELTSYAMFLKANNFSSVLDVWGCDFPARKCRFEVNYLLLNLKYNLRVVLKVNVSEVEYLNSLSGLYNSVAWLEREVWDMFGVYFSNHKDLRRILTDYGFEGHPLRKEYPLTGFTEVRYDEAEKRVVTEPLELAQGFRLFRFLSPWEINKKF